MIEKKLEGKDILKPNVNNLEVQRLDENDTEVQELLKKNRRSTKKHFKTEKDKRKPK